MSTAQCHLRMYLQLPTYLPFYYLSSYLAICLNYRVYVYLKSKTKYLTDWTKTSCRHAKVLLWDFCVQLRVRWRYIQLCFNFLPVETMLHFRFLTVHFLSPGRHNRHANKSVSACFDMTGLPLRGTLNNNKTSIHPHQPTTQTTLTRQNE